MAKLTRRQVRDNAFQIIFAKLLRDDPIEVLYDISGEIEDFTLTDDVKKLIEGVLEHSEEIDERIASFSKKRALSRIPKVNLAILRIAFYEILYDDKTPTNAAINEAVLMSQAYAYKEDTSFVNGVLSSFSKSLEMKEEGTVMERETEENQEDA